MMRLQALHGAGILMLLVAAASAGCAEVDPREMPNDAGALRAHAETWERLVAAEDGRASTPADLEALLQSLHHPEPAIRRIGVRALGRLERADLADAIAPLLHDADADVRAHAANAMAQAARGGPVDRAPLEAALIAEPAPSAAGIIAESLGRMTPGDVEEARRTLTLLIPHLAVERDVAERLGAARGLYFLARQEGSPPAFDRPAVAALRSAVVPGTESVQEQLTSRIGGEDRGHAELAVRLRTVALATLAMVGGVDEPLAMTALADAEWPVRREAVLAGAALADSAAGRRVLAAGLTDPAPPVRYEALRLYDRRPESERTCDPARQAMADPDSHVRLLAIELIGRCPHAGDSDVVRLDSLAASIHEPGWHVGARALGALAALDPDRARERLERGGLPADPFARAHATRTLATLGDTNALRRLASDEDVNVRTAAVGGLATLAGHSADDVYIAQLAADDSQLLQAAARALEGSPAPAAPAALLDALDRISGQRSETSRDARRALIARAGELGDASLAARVRPYLEDFDPVIGDLAADVLASWTGTRPVPAPVEPPPLPLPTFAEAERLARAIADIEMMDGGRVSLRLLPFEAPTNAARFARLAEQGYYDGLTFHRVVPNFVVQGGSPHANEYAGDGPFTRDELGLVGNWRGSVGLSTRGRDTGDAQLFVNLVDNVRLDHNYTVFAIVVDGQDVVDRMLEGARIRSITLRTP